MTTKRIVAAAALWGLSAIALAQDLPASTKQAAYTPQQADRGQKLYASHCLNCHAEVQFTGEAFRTAWHRQPALDLYERIRTTMPQGNPASLGRQDYADIVAWLLEINGLAAGAAELPADREGLARVVIEFPAGKIKR